MFHLISCQTVRRPLLASPSHPTLLSWTPPDAPSPRRTHGRRLHGPCLFQHSVNFGHARAEGVSDCITRRRTLRSITTRPCRRDRAGARCRTGHVKIHRDQDRAVVQCTRDTADARAPQRWTRRKLPNVVVGGESGEGSRARQVALEAARLWSWWLLARCRAAATHPKS